MHSCCLLFTYIFITGYAIANETADPIQARMERMELIDRFVYDGPLFLKDKSLPALRKLGRLQNEKMEKHPNRYIPGQAVEYITLTYDGLEIYGDVRERNRLAPILVVVTGSTWNIKHNLSVGAPMSRVIKALGEPINTNNHALRYCGETECVSFMVKDGKISKIEFDYYDG